MPQHDADLALRIPRWVKDALDTEARSLLANSSTVVRIALAEYLQRKGYSAPPEPPPPPPDEITDARQLLAHNASTRAQARKQR